MIQWIAHADSGKTVLEQFFPILIAEILSYNILCQYKIVLVTGRSEQNQLQTSLPDV